MALINCSECGKEVSDKAATCPNCGNPINQQPAAKSEEYLCCPRCNSKELHSQHKGFSGGKALVGGVLTGGIGLLAGTIGSKDVQITCLKCGKKFKAGEAKIVREGAMENDGGLKSVIEKKGVMQAVSYYKTKTGKTLSESKQYVDDFIAKHGITPAKSGCAGVILIFITLSLAISSLLL